MAHGGPGRLFGADVSGEEEWDPTGRARAGNLQGKPAAEDRRWTNYRINGSDRAGLTAGKLANSLSLQLHHVRQRLVDHANAPASHGGRPLSGDACHFAQRV